MVRHSTTGGTRPFEWRLKPMRTMNLRPKWLAMSLCANLFPFAASAGAQTGTQFDRLTAEDAEAWLDGFMSYALPRGAIPGAVVVIVKDGRVLLEKGYGVSDVATDTLVNPQETLFRLGSVSKLFTWTAVMQLVENGKLDLDADINRYLDFKIPPFHDKPITLRNLKTHTSGFEEAVGGIAAQDPAHIPSLGTALKRWTPTRVFDPGTTPAYSNYGAALAGYIVERVSGEPFSGYVTRHIFAPLGMAHSTFEQPLRPEFLARMSKGYSDGEAAPGPYELVVWQPAGSVSATGDDMSRFMIAHLQHGNFGETQLLKPVNADLMHTTALTLLPPLDRMDLGFYEENINGHRVIGHEGDTVFFHTGLSLYLDDGVGIFVALNGVGKDDAVYGVRTQLSQAFSDRYMPGKGADGSVEPLTARMHARMFAHSYSASRAWHTSFMSAFNVFFPTTVTANSDGTISVSTSKTLSGGLRRYRETAPFVWTEINGHDRIAAVVKDHTIVRFSSDDYSPFLVMDAVPWWRSAALLEPAAITALLIILLTTLAWPVSAMTRRHYGVKFPLQGRRAHSRRLFNVMAAVALAAAAGWAWIVSVVIEPIGIYFLADDVARIYAIELLTIVGFAGGFAASLYHLAVTFRASSGRLAKVWSVVLMLSMLSLLWVGMVCKLMNLQIRF
jgi:CubicO group peptidase (beta-lactamase class C family)